MLRLDGPAGQLQGCHGRDDLEYGQFLRPEKVVRQKPFQKQCEKKLKSVTCSYGCLGRRQFVEQLTPGSFDINGSWSMSRDGLGFLTVDGPAPIKIAKPDGAIFVFQKLLKL